MSPPASCYCALLTSSVDCQTRDNNNHILGEAGVYLPADYAADMEGIPLRGCVHVEAFPTDQLLEVTWLEVCICRPDRHVTRSFAETLPVKHEELL